ncbi:twin-arginine translocase TatA/TatE family subunit [Tessaracoccus sp. OH4464_COT-324]|uniref:twin-arginine translocase TatA/TatE family subunit n=1 Tax=Tessaracoccus sp. OH4464_COT-324 TaxID=2491059 RepID=UPI000F640988|nr:twin-arginine translocase TatA/TatE family subunit [Tessaracoccus sp. OH4464_COT-324]RRD47521.1 twin-arginine translocase TatA/TatE family subunit [Tessaracoccus sp. OH4464_COT-324]
MSVLVIGGLGWQELLIILAVVLLLFGGSRLAGIGKGVGRSIREFKEEVKSDPKELPEAEAAESSDVRAEENQREQ